tara:strand:- start:863 stop:3100 length:2238 start_codon:yes stop_codon:yes gene_type:complete
VNVIDQMTAKLGYNEYVQSKQTFHETYGFEPKSLNVCLFDWQAEVVRWALRKGRACLFEDCGLGKTIQQLAWAEQIPGDVLVLTPLAVAEQTANEAKRFRIDAEVSRDGTKHAQITITNYEQMHRFDLDVFTGLVLDESSILKAQTGKIRTAIINAAANIPYRLACTATPAPNDHIELGNHAEFVGSMTTSEMLARFFVHDAAKTQDWRLKGHAKADFWEWVATWALMIRTPEDIGFDGSDFVLPELTTVEHHVTTDTVQDGELFAMPVLALNDQRRARKNTIETRVAEVAALANSSDEQWIIWCELNTEGDALADAIPDAVQVAGSDNDDVKRERLLSFQSGDSRVLVTKPKIGGFGMNWQHCRNVAFVGLSHSWEQFYQSVRRCWRFGQDRPVFVHIISTDVEAAVLLNIKRKQASADEMAAEMVLRMRDTMIKELTGQTAALDTINTGDVVRGDGWTMYHGDCVDVVSSIEAESVGYSVFSPPFASLYTYTDDPRDMGNCTDGDAFFDHFKYLIPELYRVTIPGRLLSFHCMDLPTSKARDGFIGLTDFRGELIRAFMDEGWILHSQVCIWKDPVTAMQRTKALGLLHKQIKKDSCMSRQGIPDYLVTMRKPGDNPERVEHTAEEFPVRLWQRYASPVWMDINPSDTLQFRSARDHEDERHICPLQIEVIRRALKLWSNPGDLVLSPFAGIGSEGFVSLDCGREFVGVELKPSYFRASCANLDMVASQGSLFGETAAREGES